MALAIRFEGLLRKRTIRDLAELARLGGVTRARMTQIMQLLDLAPDIQEQILFLPHVKRLKPCSYNLAFLILDCGGVGGDHRQLQRLLILFGQD
jgi:hypothetical protein